ncbi:hypothetical protein TanjilG_27681 [Lupinus angustifolius]|uniref:SH3 domain-containing protein n=1 Tax=Lupinus angustifolius TaxID=3871 RepID=A0A4P1RHW0_LUPAN|nr:hypothetical protein TanjilG_27681 [Lupinus angustifolius]
MDSIRKQASKLRDQVAKQQQALLRQLGQISNEPLMTHESELQCQHKLENLYTSTKAAKISEPLRAQITGAPLEDARHLTQRYEKLRHEVEAQAAEVLRRRSKLRGSSVSAESSMKLQNAETRLKELKSALVALGREATAAMLSVEEQQQQLNFQSLCTMVDAERAYHGHALVILEKVYAEMTEEKQPKESSSYPLSRDGYDQTADDNSNLNGFDQKHTSQTGSSFFAKVIHPFDAQADGELNLSVDDYVVVCQVDPNGWSEGECKGNAGWFPSAYIQRQDLIQASKIVE